MPKLQEVKGRFTLTIPHWVVESQGWKKGDNIEPMNIVMQSFKDADTKEVQVFLVKTNKVRK